MRRLAKVSAAATATMVVAIAAGLAIGGRDFMRQHLGTLVVAVAMIVVMGSIAAHLLGGLVRGAVLAVRRPRALGQSGAAAAEFVIVVIPFLLTLFGLMQMALASMARVLVSYSAFCAARAAIVFVPAEPKSGGLSTGSPLPLPVATLNEDANTIGKGNDSLTDFTTSSKAALLRNAASYALIPSSPAIDVVVADTANNWGQYWVDRVGHGLSPLDWVKNNVSDPQKQAALEASLDKFVDDAVKGGTGAAGGWVTNGINSTLDGPLSQYKDQISKWAAGAAQGAGGNIGGNFTGYSVDRALDVGFGSGTDGPQGALLRSLRKLIYARMATVVTLVDEKGNLKTKFEATEPITAKVTYLFYCQIPMANRFAGKAFYDLPDKEVMALTTGPLGPAAMVGIPGYFMTLQADHVLVNQGKP